MKLYSKGEYHLSGIQNIFYIREKIYEYYWYSTRNSNRIKTTLRIVK